MEAQPFKMNVPDAVLADLQERLASTRWPDEIPGSAWDYGSNLDYMKELVDYWRTGFDWRAQERAINAFPQYRATVDGFGIHFIHERGKGPNPIPLIITHGWPSSIAEMLKIIPLLTDPASHGADPQTPSTWSCPLLRVRILGPADPSGDALLANRRPLG